MVGCRCFRYTSCHATTSDRNLDCFVAMKVLAIISVIAFVISLPMRWYKNSWLGAGALDIPPVMRPPQNRLLFLALTFSLTCFGVFGIWYFFGLWLAIGAFSLSWLVSKASWNRQFNFEVER